MFQFYTCWKKNKKCSTQRTFHLSGCRWSTVILTRCYQLHYCLSPNKHLSIATTSRNLKQNHSRIESTYIHVYINTCMRQYSVFNTRLRSGCICWWQISRLHVNEQAMATHSPVLMDLPKHMHYRWRCDKSSVSTEKLWLYKSDKEGSCLFLWRTWPQ